MRRKFVTPRLQLPLDLCVIINFPVEDNSALAAIFQDRLIAAFQIDDFKSRCSEREDVRAEYALLVGATVRQCRHHLAHFFSVRLRTFMCESRYAAQSRMSLETQPRNLPRFNLEARPEPCKLTRPHDSDVRSSPIPSFRIEPCGGRFDRCSVAVVEFVA